MKIENEITVLNVDREDLIHKIISAGGVETCPEVKQIRCVYDFVPKNHNKWIRLRTNGHTTTLTIKQLNDKSKMNVKELEIEVSDFWETDRILNELGYKYRNRQENLRQIFILNGAEISIDTWPMIPTYAEIEADNIDTINRVIEVLGIDRNSVTDLDVVSIYNDIYGIDIMSIKDLRLK